MSKLFKLINCQKISVMRTPMGNQSLAGSNVITPQKVPQKTQAISPMPVPSMYSQPPRPMPRTPINTRSISLSGTPSGQSIPPYSGMGSAFGGTPPMGLQQRRIVPKQITPYPIINQSQKGMFEKVVDYLIGDGPSSRYGMICKECYGHNGNFPFFK